MAVERKHRWGDRSHPVQDGREHDVDCAPSELDAMWEQQGGQCVEPSGQGEAGRGWV